MKILITGTTGYIAKRLVLKLVDAGHELVCCVRDLKRIPDEIEHKENISFIKVDFLQTEKIVFPSDIDVAYYLIHSMATDATNFEDLEQTCAKNFKNIIEKTNCKQVIYLSGIVNDSSLSKHLASRFQVEQNLQSLKYNVTTFRAGIIVGSGSASFEIIRDIVEKLPVMVTPKWLNTKSQPIAIRDVLTFLERAVGNEKLYNKSFDICGTEVLTYKEMLLQFSEVRGFKRYILTLPLLTPKLSSYWLYFVTSTSFNLAQALVDSMKVEVIAKSSNINQILNISPISYKESVDLAFQRIEQNAVISSWKDAISSGVFQAQLSDHIQIPQYGCFIDERTVKVIDDAFTLDKIWSIGGKNGWYSFNWLWKIRGYADKIFGGVGLRRGRTHNTSLEAGDPLDFWRVLLADKKEKRLLLFAEMKLPGEAWLEFKIVNDTLHQKAVFRPKGVLGRLYWYSVLPFHAFVFKGMINALVKK
ncbi:SDR family oxidoreductase [Tenacibaculum finnmarkense genomovar ulcerans]|uniref:SDR family oxidoreductase n=1 Tax=Tenacibaculum finnmarkense TaxID=2781243 RepID=UPI001E64A64C|nr:SDR family oxidoreductase [Tenacibaculum finnmarkense]MCD8432806.1 SDR family oxidoreductase [Tenacibaculum finnmarkense genomovar ulcerans]WCC42730.1 SDR family oxidoreductase [Tenacibaculum finnmarkense]